MRERERGLGGRNTNTLGSSGGAVEVVKKSGGGGCGGGRSGGGGGGGGSNGGSGGGKAGLDFLLLLEEFFLVFQRHFDLARLSSQHSLSVFLTVSPNKCSVPVCLALSAKEIAADRKSVV